MLRLLRPLRRTAALVAGPALDLLYPPICLACRDRLPPSTPGGLPLCASCFALLPAASPTVVAERLARLSPPPRTGHALALWTFDSGGVLQRLQHALKYGDRPTLGVRTGVLLGQAWLRARLPLPDAVVPIPLARRRHLERGYNQAERLAAGLGHALSAPVAEALARTRSTRSQTRLSRDRRQANVAGAFALDGPLPGRCVLLVDDVLTTGATLAAAAAPLLDAGAAVDLAALAIARD